jgi:enamine deaminase RidA (YjgF/YER057c/UK114 family)
MIQLINLEYRNVCVEISRYRVSRGINEYHVMLHATKTQDSFKKQLSGIHAALKHYMNIMGADVHAVFRRYFLSDIANQLSVLQDKNRKAPTGAVSVVQQPPLDGSKVALWIYLKSDVETASFGDSFVEKHGGYSHVWTAAALPQGGDAGKQTKSLLQDYANTLKGLGCSLEDDCIRTWLFVRNIDANYQGVVEARKAFFEKKKLTEQTHYIASTGIEGGQADPKVLVQMDAYAIKGLKSGQARHLKALSHLCPTHDYGVTFERGTVVEYGDRSHIFISGTASINSRGDIVHPGDVAAQTLRMIENIEALLAEADAVLRDVICWIVYLRDLSDYQVVNGIFDKQFHFVPRIITLAAVCRPGWLVEAECIAIKENVSPQYAVL